MRKWIWAALAVALLGLGACGDDGDADAAASQPETTGAEAGAPEGDGPEANDDATTGPVVIEHRYGSTTIDATPQRIVSYDQQWTDVLAALDAPVVGALFSPFGGRFAWQTDVLPEVEELPFTNGSIPFEAIAAQQPDLIVIEWELTDESAYDKLSQIAPTIPRLSDTEAVTPWQEMAATAGKVLGMQDAATALVTDAEQVSADLLAELPGLEGKTYVMANYMAGQGIWIIADPDDGADAVFSQLGLEIAPHLLELPNRQQGRAQISVEQIQLLDADYLILLANGADPESIPGYSALPVVQAGAVTLMNAADATALNTPSPLSIPYALELIRPKLEVVAG